MMHMLTVQHNMFNVKHGRRLATNNCNEITCFTVIFTIFFLKLTNKR